MPDYIDTTDLLAKALRDNVAFVPGVGAFVDGRGTDSMRLNFSAQTEDEIREGIRRIGSVIAEQVNLYETMTGEHQITPAQSSASRPVAPGRGRLARQDQRVKERGEPADEPGDVLPFHRRPER
jgi:2-aminoadipate transaminase